MKVFGSTDEIPAGFGQSVVTVGKFDGVHEGHRAIIRQLESSAAQQGLRSVAVTFDRHPFQTLAPAKCPIALVSLEQKLELLAETGLDAVLVLCFDDAFAKLEADDFVRTILVDALQAKLVLVGRDFRFGARGAGSIDTLYALSEEHGFAVQCVDDVRPTGERRVSSTWIRQLLADGDVAGAAGLLGHLPSVRGAVVHGAQRGRDLGFPTANLSPESEGLIPADGVYAGYLADGRERYPSAISVGDNPTFPGAPQKQVEAYVLDRDLDLYDHVVDVSFVERIRGMVAFDGVDSLVIQMQDDVDRTREILR